MIASFSNYLNRSMYSLFKCMICVLFINFYLQFLYIVLNSFFSRCLPNLAFGGFWIHLTSNRTIENFRKICIILKRFVCTNRVGSMFVRKLYIYELGIDEKVKNLVSLTESFIVPLKGFEQNDRPALIKNNASDENR